MASPPDQPDRCAILLRNAGTHGQWPFHPVRVRLWGDSKLTCALARLHKQGIKIKLHDQPFQVLAALLEHPGELVTREQPSPEAMACRHICRFRCRPLILRSKRLRDALGDFSGGAPLHRDLAAAAATASSPLWRTAPEQGTPEDTGSRRTRHRNCTPLWKAMDSPGSAASSARPPPALVEPGLVWALPGLGVSGGAALCDHALLRNPPAVPPRRRWGQCRAPFEDSTRSKGSAPPDRASFGQCRSQ